MDLVSFTGQHLTPSDIVCGGSVVIERGEHAGQCGKICSYAGGKIVEVWTAQAGWVFVRVSSLDFYFD